MGYICKITKNCQFWAKPDIICPGIFFRTKAVKLDNAPHIFQLIESIKIYKANGALKSKPQQQLTLVINLANIEFARSRNLSVFHFMNHESRWQTKEAAMQCSQFLKSWSNKTPFFFISTCIGGDDAVQPFGN